MSMRQITNVLNSLSGAIFKTSVGLTCNLKARALLIDALLSRENCFL
jgi:hypothetical protein